MLKGWCVVVFAGSIFGISLLFLTGYLLPSQPVNTANQKEQSLKLSLLSTYHSSFSTRSNQETRVSLDQDLKLLSSNELNNFKPDLLVLPEDSRLAYRLNASNVNIKIWPKLKSLTPTPSTLIIDSIRTEESSNIKSQILYINTAKEQITTTEKQLLVPYGEYLPYFARGLAILSGQRAWLADYDQKRSVQAGHAFRPVPWQGEKLGILLCDEIFSPNLYRMQTKAGATILGNVSSQALFHDSKWFYRQSLAAARLRAAENGRTLFQATNAAPSFVVNQGGQVTTESTWHEPGLVLQEVETSTNLTPYVRFGNWPLSLALLVFGYTLLTALFRLPTSKETS